MSSKASRAAWKKFLLTSGALTFKACGVVSFYADAQVASAAELNTYSDAGIVEDEYELEAEWESGSLWMVTSTRWLDGEIVERRLKRYMTSGEPDEEGGLEAELLQDSLLEEQEGWQDNIDTWRAP